MEQQSFLRQASIQLGLSYRALAQALGVSERTVEKWSLKSASPDHRAMPLMAIRFILRMLEDRKREAIAAGDRASAEVIDALGAQVDADRLAESLRTFDALQRSSMRLAVFEAPLRKPRSFASFAQKNAWERKEETRLARRAQATSARKR
jgi:transcriptional regulator with XRE-family HTH domain